jgi:RNA polymerase sigma-54 factor
MNLGFELGMNMGLEQKLSPQMIQSLQLLQMNSLELEMAVKQELETNPLLETLEDGGDDEGPLNDLDEGGDDEGGAAELPAATAEASLDVAGTGAGDAAEGAENLDAGGLTAADYDPALDAIPSESPQAASDEIDWESYLEDGFDPSEGRNEEREAPEELFERTPVYDVSLQDHLLEQLKDRELGSEIHDLVEYLIYSLDDRGWLVTEPPVVAARSAKAEKAEKAEKAGDGTHENTDAASTAAAIAAAPVDRDPRHQQIVALIEGRIEPAEADGPVREALHVLQSFDPAGIGARDLRECLLLQMRRTDKISPLARRIVEEEFELLERLKIAALAKKLDSSPEEIQSAVREIGTLEPHPGRLLAPTAAATVVPDLIVEEIEGELVLMLNDRTIPSLRISRAYAGLLRKGSRASADEKKFVRGKLNAATWLIRAIEQRKSTMLKVMHAILESQPEFFRSGPAHLRPLILQQVADKIGMHISTVSRVTNGKYVQTPHGIFELKYFFSASVTQADGSEVSSVAARDEIKRLIESEDSKNPLSDQKIVEILKSRGLDVARRTVAKYRDQLEILPARLRKKY